MPECRVCTVFLPASAQSTLLLFFSVTLFAINPTFIVLFFQNHYFNPPTGQKDVCTPTAATVLHLRQKKKNSKLLYITCSYGRSLARKQSNREAHNLIMYNSRTRSTLCPAPLPESLKISPPPNSCAENKKHVVICLSMCLQYMISIFAPFRSRSCVRSSR